MKRRHLGILGAVLLVLVLGFWGFRSAFANPPDVNIQNLRLLGKDFKKALNDKDVQKLQNVTDSAYWDVIKNKFQGTNPDGLGNFRLLKRSIEFLDEETGCFYLECRQPGPGGLTLLVLVTVKVKQQSLIICCGPRS